MPFIDVKIIEAQADRLRRRAERDGLTRPEQPEEAKPAKKTAAALARASPVHAREVLFFTG